MQSNHANHSIQTNHSFNLKHSIWADDTAAEDTAAKGVAIYVLCTDLVAASSDRKVPSEWMDRLNWFIPDDLDELNHSN